MNLKPETAIVNRKSWVFPEKSLAPEGQVGRLVPAPNERTVDGPDNPPDRSGRLWQGRPRRGSTDAF